MAVGVVSDNLRSACCQGQLRKESRAAIAAAAGIQVQAIEGEAATCVGVDLIDSLASFQVQAFCPSITDRSQLLHVGQSKSCRSFPASPVRRLPHSKQQQIDQSQQSPGCIARWICSRAAVLALVVFTGIESSQSRVAAGAQASERIRRSRRSVLASSVPSSVPPGHIPGQLGTQPGNTGQIPGTDCNALNFLKDRKSVV